jgi:hypothetical protein
MGLKIGIQNIPAGLQVLSDAGNESTVYRIPGNFSIPGHKGPFLLKRYKEAVLLGREAAVESALDRIVTAYVTANDRYRRIIDDVAAWSVATVTGDLGALGLIMREIGPEFMSEGSARRSLKTPVAPLEMWIQAEVKIRDRGLTPFTDEGRKRYLRRTTLYFSMVHSLGWIIGDISLNNILAYVPSPSEQRTRCSPGFIEIDTYRPLHGGSAMPQRHTYEFTPPEARAWKRKAKALAAQGANSHDIIKCESKARVQTRESDVYKAGLLALRLYDEGKFPTQAKYQPSATLHLARVFGADILDPVHAAVAANPKDRPTMNELARAFMKG